MSKPFAASADRNKAYILNELRRELKDKRSVLEIGSGTGQHACYFGQALKHIIWQPTDLQQNLPAINAWLNEAELENVLTPKLLDVNDYPWSVNPVDVCYTCNTLHIVDMSSVDALFKGCRRALVPNGLLCAYGPFKVNGEHTSSSNREFDLWLRERDPNSGLRDLKDLDAIATSYGFAANRNVPMPANSHSNNN